MRKVIISATAHFLAAGTGFFLCGCSNSETTSLFMDGSPIVMCDEPRETIEIKGTEVVIPEEVSIGSMAVFSTNDENCIFLRYDNDFSFTWYDFSSQESFSFLGCGRGPGEMAMADYAGITRNDKGETLLGAYDINQGRYALINVSKSIIEKKTIFEAETSVPDNCMNIRLSGSDLLCNVIWDDDMNSIKKIGADGIVKETWRLFGNEEYTKKYDMFQFIPALSPDGDKMVLGMLGMPRLNILDMVGDKHISISTEVRTDSDIISDISTPGFIPKTFYCDVTATDSRIYALCWNYRTNEKEGCQELQVFDWSGKYLKKYVLDVPINNFYLSQKNDYIIGLDMDGIMYRYDLI